MSLGSSDEWTDQATMIADVEGRVARLSRENAAMREALRPFAMACLISTYLDDQEIDDTMAATKITWGDLRKARAALAQLDAPPAEEAPPLAIDYANWRGERRTRNIIPLRPFFGSNEWHKEPQWLLEAIDPEDGKTKTFAFAGIHGFGDPAEEAERRFDEWIRELDEDVIKGEYGYESGEFTVYPDHWRSAFDEGLSPKQAFDRSLKAYADARKERDREAKANYEIIKANDRATIAEHALAAARQTIAEAVGVMNDCRAVERAVERLATLVKTGVRLYPDSFADANDRARKLGDAARAFVEARGKKEAE